MLHCLQSPIVIRKLPQVDLCGDTNGQNGQISQEELSMLENLGRRIVNLRGYRKICQYQRTRQECLSISEHMARKYQYQRVWREELSISDDMFEFASASCPVFRMFCKWNKKSIWKKLHRFCIIVYRYSITRAEHHLLKHRINSFTTALF